MQQNDTNKFREITWSQDQQHALARSSSNAALLCIHRIEVHEIDYEGDKEKVHAFTSCWFNGLVKEDNHLLEYAREDYEHNKTIGTILKH